MSDDFHFDIPRHSSDFPAFIEGKRVGINEQGRHFVTIGGRKWVLDPNEPPLETLFAPEQFQSFPPPPRQVTLMGRLTLLFGAGISGLLPFGCFFTCFGMLFVCSIAAQGIADSFAIWRVNGEACVTSIETSFSDDGKPGFAYLFSGQDAAGNNVTGVSYESDKHANFEEGQTVPLQRTWFLGEKWRLKGATFAQYGDLGYFMLFLIMFPTVGLGIIFFGTILPGLKRTPVFIDGELALATFLRQESTGARVNNRTVQKLVFQFETPEGEQYEASLKTLEPDKFLSDNSRKIVFYNPDHPKKSMVWDSVASMMKFDEFQQRFTGFTINIPIFLVFFTVFCFEIVWFCNNVMTGKMFF